MNDNEYLKKLQNMTVKLGEDIFYTLKDDEGIVRPLAGLWTSDSYGKDDADARAKQTKMKVVTIQIKEI